MPSNVAREIGLSQQTVDQVEYWRCRLNGIRLYHGVTSRLLLWVLVKVQMLGWLFCCDF